MRLQRFAVRGNAGRPPNRKEWLYSSGRRAQVDLSFAAMISGPSSKCPQAAAGAKILFEARNPVQPPTAGSIMKCPGSVLAGSMLLLIGQHGAFAHHSYAMFDHSRTVTVQGSVARVEWVN